MDMDVDVLIVSFVAVENDATRRKEEASGKMRNLLLKPLLPFLSLVYNASVQNNEIVVRTYYWCGILLSKARGQV